MDRTQKRDGRTDGRTDGLMDGRTVRLLYASQSSFGGIKIIFNYALLPGGLELTNIPLKAQS